ncbi:MAG: hypothetical protein ACK4VY_01080 [Brevundimonas sp.]
MRQIMTACSRMLWCPDESPCPLRRPGTAAAERVFGPATYTVVIEERVGTDRGGQCRGREGLTINAQRTGFAIRKGFPFDRLPDFTAIQAGNRDLRSGVDLILRPHGGEPVRVLSVHLKSGCSSGDRAEACAALFEQVPVLERWIDERADERIRFAVLGDFNRRLAMPTDAGLGRFGRCLTGEL